MPASKAQRAKTAERRAQAIALKLAGATYEQIADQLGYSGRGAAWTDLDRAFKERREQLDEQVDTMRHVEGMRLDRLQAAVWSRAIRGDEKAVETVLKISDRRTRLFGLDAPVRTDVTVTIPATEDERREQLAELARLAQLAAVGDAEAILTSDQEPDQ